MLPDKRTLLTMNGEELIKLAKNPVLTKPFQEMIQRDIQVRQKLCGVLTTERVGADFLTQLAYDGTGNFIVQKLLDPNFADTNFRLVENIEHIAPSLALNRYGCRVVQKLMQISPPDHVERLLTTKFSDQEFELVTDQNGNRIVQKLIENFEPGVYLPFLRSMIDSAGLKHVLVNKYGCRVMQAALERAVQLCTSNQQLPSTKSAANAVMNLLITPILEDASALCKDVYGNYIVQTIFKIDFLHYARRYIIKHHLMNNILALSQHKYSSHVVEMAFNHADDDSRCAMFLEVFESYEPDSQGRTALHIMLFDQYGNYVVQRMLDIAIKVRLGQRVGDAAWFHQIVSYAHSVRTQLARYSSGQKILETIQKHMATLRQPLLGYPAAPAYSYRNNHNYQNRNNQSCWTY